QSPSLSHATLVYKSATPLIFSADRTIVGTRQGNRWLGKAGTGDVVAGSAAAYLCQEVNAREAFLRAMQYVGDAANHCLLHRSGHSIIATDIIDCLGSTGSEKGSS